MCLYPVEIKNPRYKGILTEHEYYLHSMDESIADSLTIKVPCGKCPECLAKKQMQWSFRLMAHAEQSTSATFLTLTYEDSALPYRNGWPTLEKREFQLFMKKLRNYTKKKSDVPLRYFACGEYGSKTDRPHYHAIMFNLPKPFNDVVEQAWTKGFAGYGDVNIQTIMYVTKYSLKGNRSRNQLLDDKGRIPEFNLMSKGLGKDWITQERADYLIKNRTRYVTMEGGHEVILPRYLVDKLPFKDEGQRMDYMADSAMEMLVKWEGKFNIEDLSAVDRFEYADGIEKQFKRKKQRSSETL